MAEPKKLNNVEIRVFSRPDEKPEDILSGLKELLFVDFEKEKLKIGKQKATGAFDDLISIYTLFFDKQRHIKVFLDVLKKKLNKQQKELFQKQAESRLNDKNKFYIRIDKKNWLESREIWIVSSGPCYHITFTVASYPATRENGIKVIKGLFD